MSNKKHTFTGHEGWMLEQGLKLFIEAAEAETTQKTTEAQEKGRVYMIAPGYFTLVGGELLEKVKSMTSK